MITKFSLCCKIFDVIYYEILSNSVQFRQNTPICGKCICKQSFVRQFQKYDMPGLYFYQRPKASLSFETVLRELHAR